MAKSENGDDKNAVDLIFSVLQKEYEGEDTRNKHLETKVQMMLALSGILVSAVMLFVKVIIEKPAFLVLKTSLMAFALFLILIAVFDLLTALKIKAFKRVDHNVLANLNLHSIPEEDAKAKLLHDYNDCINASVPILKEKAAAIKSASNLLEVAVIIFGIVVLASIVGLNFEEGSDMSKDSTGGKNTNQQTKQQIIRPATGRQLPLNESNKGKGFGTVDVEKNETRISTK